MNSASLQGSEAAYNVSVAASTSSEDKPTVLYRALSLSNIEVGHMALVITVNHWDVLSVTNGCVVKTGEVVAYDKATGYFETVNSKYVLDETYIN